MKVVMMVLRLPMTAARIANLIPVVMVRLMKGSNVMTAMKVTTTAA